MKMRELIEDSYINEWFDTINPSDNTKKHYISAMQFYTEFTGKTPKIRNQTKRDRSIEKGF